MAGTSVKLGAGLGPGATEGNGEGLSDGAGEGTDEGGGDAPGEGDGAVSPHPAARARAGSRRCCTWPLIATLRRVSCRATVAAVSVGQAARRRATLPATSGVAIEVPLQLP